MSWQWCERWSEYNVQQYRMCVCVRCVRCALDTKAHSTTTINEWWTVNVCHLYGTIWWWWYITDVAYAVCHLRPKLQRRNNISSVHGWLTLVTSNIYKVIHSPMSQSGSLSNCSFTAITYQTQLSQWATSEKHNINSVNIMPVYCEYLSIFWSKRASRNNRVNFTRWICDSCGVCGVVTVLVGRWERECDAVMM